MADIDFTPSELGRLRGFQANLRIRGRNMVADTTESVRVLVQNASALPDPERPAQGTQPVYAMSSCLAGAVRDPRAIGKFTEGDGANQTVHKVLAYTETSGDRVTWKFEVESQRADLSAQDGADPEF